MKKVIRENDYFLLFSCFILGVIAELAFFQGDIGVSYLVFVSAFYFVFFLRFRLSAFHHRRVGLLFMLVIWLLSTTFLFYGRNVFYTWNLIIIPVVIFIHIIIITRPNTFVWQTVYFLKTMGRILYEALFYVKALVKKLWTEMKRHKVIALIALLLFVGIIIWVSGHVFIHVLRSLGIGALIFSVFQVLCDQQVDKKQYLYVKQQGRSIPAKQARFISILIAVIMIGYYFISQQIESLHDTYKLLLILTVVMFGYFYFILDKVKAEKQGQMIFFKVIHSLFIVCNVYFIAIHLRELGELDEVSGLSSGQFIQHTILYFFMIMYLYTLIRIWVKRISLTHFYFIFSLLFYMTLNMINVAQIVADYQYVGYTQGTETNITQFEELFYPGYEKLLQIYEVEPSEQLRNTLIRKAEEEIALKQNWQSYNFSRESWLTLFEEKVNQTPIEGEGK